MKRRTHLCLVGLVLTSAATAAAAPKYHLIDLGGSYSIAHGINNLGQVVGESRVTDDSTHAFLYSDGTMQDLNALVTSAGGWEAWEAWGINDSGQIVGSVDPLGPSGFPNHAFLYDGGNLTVLGLDETNGQSVGRSINNSGQVSGSATGHGAFLFDGTMQYLGSARERMDTVSTTAVRSSVAASCGRQRRRMAPAARYNP